MSKFGSLFKKKETFSLPEFSERASKLRPFLNQMDVKKKVSSLIDVSKVWTYDYDERKEFMQELFDALPEKTQSSMIEFMSNCIPNRDVSKDIPLALSQIKKEKLNEFISLIA